MMASSPVAEKDGIGEMMRVELLVIWKAGEKECAEESLRVVMMVVELELRLAEGLADDLAFLPQETE